MAAINDIFKADVVFGDRYAHMNMTFHGNPKAQTDAAAPAADGVCVSVCVSVCQCVSVCVSV